MTFTQDRRLQATPTITPGTAPATPPRCLRVLFVSHTYVVGLNQGKLAALAQAGARVGLLAPARWRATSWNQTFALAQDQPQVEYFPAGVGLNGRTGGYVYGLGSLLRALWRFRPDLLQVEEEVFSLSTFQLAVVARLTGIPLVVFGWENLDHPLPRMRRWTRQFVLATAGLIVAGNQDGAALLRQWGYGGQIAVMPQMGVDGAVFRATPRIWSGERPLRIGYMGRLVPEKGVDLILTAARQLREAGLAVEMILCGSGPDEARLRQVAEQQQVADRVTWTGKVAHDQVPDVMARFDVLVLPSRTTPTWKEQFGHVLIEAMALGVPVLGADSGEIPHVIHRPDLVFAENNATGLARLLQRLMQDPAWYGQISQYGIDRVQTHYTHGRMAQQLIAHWQRLRPGRNLDPFRTDHESPTTNHSNGT